MGKRLSVTQHNNIMQLHKEGLTTRQIADNLGLSFSCVAKHIKGIVNPIEMVELMKEAYQLYQEGKTLKEIADKQYIHFTVVSYRIKTYKQKYL